MRSQEAPGGDEHSFDLRRSRLRFADWGQVLLLKYPVRCSACRLRDFISIARAVGQ